MSESDEDEYEEDTARDEDEEEDDEEGDDEEEAEEEEAEEYDESEDSVPAYTANLPATMKRHRRLKALLLSKYDSVRKTTELLGWRSFYPEDCTAGSGLSRRSFHVCWSDSSVTPNRVSKLGRMQKINHFPGMLELVRKAGTARNLNKMLTALGKPYKFFPQTFMLPADYTALKQEWGERNHGNKTFIVKPSKGCQGTGIRLTRCLDEISPHEPNIVQRYLHRPHLLDGYKYDLRLYVLLSSVQPLRIFLFREGLVRVCTQKYQPLEKNMGDTRMHLTNYSINKDSEAFVQPEDETDCDDAHKRTVTSLMDTLAAEGHDIEALWQRIGEVVVKTIISVQPHLEHTYFTCRGRADDAGAGCFELLGFDVMMDHKLRPSLLEINHTPSFRCDSPLDTAVKMSVLRGTMEMVSYSKEEYRLLKRPGRISSSPDMRARLVGLRERYELSNAKRLGFDTIYPPCAATCGGDEDAADALLSEYDMYLSVAARLHTDMSLSGSRRLSSNCSSLGQHSKLERAKSTDAPGSFHASAAAAVFQSGLKAGLKAGRDVINAARAKDAAEPPSPFKRGESPGRERPNASRPPFGSARTPASAGHTVRKAPTPTRPRGASPGASPARTPGRGSSPAKGRRRPSPKHHRPKTPTTPVLQRVC